MAMAAVVPSREPIFNWNFWDAHAQPPLFIKLSCMMPNSIFLTLEAKQDMTLADVKDILWSMARAMPLSGHLLCKTLYIFQYINRQAKSQEASDESIRLRDLKPVAGVLRLQRRCLDSDGVAELDDRIGSLIGKDLKEFGALKSDEVDHFREQINYIAQEHADSRPTRDPKNPTDRLLQLYPNRLADSDRLPEWLQSRLGKDHRLKVDIEWKEQLQTKLTLKVAYNSTPRKLLERIFDRCKVRQDPSHLLLKVCGQSEYLTRDKCHLIQFIYIQEMLGREAHPRFVVVEKMQVSKQLDEKYKLSTTVFAKPLLKQLCRTEPSWKIGEKFKCTVLAASKLNLDVTKISNLDVEIHAGIFHGDKALSGRHVTSNPDMSSISKGIVRWMEEVIIFDIQVCDIPRMARLCFVVVEKIRGSLAKKNKKNDIPLAWVNTPIFEYNNQLKVEKITDMHMWEYSNDIRTNELLHPLGTIAQNPSTEQCITMTICYGQYSTDSLITYAPNPELNISMRKLALNCPVDAKLEQKIEQMKKNAFYEMHEQDWEDLWAMRMSLPTRAPELLPKLLQCTDWSNQENVACVTHLLNMWPPIRVECALELLDYAHTEPVVRKFAVERLKDLQDDQLSLYLLQLINALKHEPYLMCELAIFILKRAYKNLKIGHFVFWQLRSEMHNPFVNIRFGLLLEGYLRGNQHHMPVLMRQVNCLQKLIDISDIIRKKKDIDSARTELIKYLDDPHYSEALSNFANALNPSIQCSRVIPERCRVMDSKMRPLLLVFENGDTYGQDIHIIMKKGDDLRQDMFTLQMMRIMDQLWKEEGYDFRINAYGCISMGDQVGMIEVVLEAQTIAKIQKEKGSIGIRSGSIYAWLKDHNPEETLQKAVSEFMWSCAGYCVATYVLGVGDRHSDNIMVKKNGQLFHIDFGHILGNFKKLLGVRRERVPFVLAREFVNVINDGNRHSHMFNDFRNNCEKAYLVLRKHGLLIVSLFSMMISTELPELGSEEDLKYLQETLALYATEDEAKAHFHSKFDEALRNNGNTMALWFFHNMARNN